jgi:TRAP-type C4-dicarboxylate transport system substrate-binding protein
MKDAYKLAIDAFDILVKEKTFGRINVPVGPGDWLGGRVAGAGAGPT